MKKIVDVACRCNARVGAMLFEQALELVRSLGADGSTVLASQCVLEARTGAFMAFAFRNGLTGPRVFAVPVFRESDGFKSGCLQNASFCPSLWKELMGEWKWLEVSSNA